MFSDHRMIECHYLLDNLLKGILLRVTKELECKTYLKINQYLIDCSLATFSDMV